MTTQPTNAEWLYWVEVQKKVTETWADGDLAGAIGLIDRYLEGVASSDLRRKAVAFRGDLHEERGDRGAAMADFQLAHSLSEKPDYERYTLEIALGGISEMLGSLKTAEHWYVRALKTASTDPTTSGGTALLRFLKIRRNQGLAEEERLLAEKVLRQSWHLLRVEGEPDFDDLEVTVKKLVAAQGRQFPPSAVS